MSPHPRSQIYYWKCDRPAAFHGTHERGALDTTFQPQLHEAMRSYFNTSNVVLHPSASQGNHLTWNADVEGASMFVRVENGPERDDHLEMESAVMRKVRSTDVPVPEVFAVDASRKGVSFAWQAIEQIDDPDLNHWHKRGTLEVPRIAFEIGAAVARWQAIQPGGFGPFNLARWRHSAELSGFHSIYESYFRLRLEEHLSYLAKKAFLPAEQRKQIEQAIDTHRELLRLSCGCLVHKDLALWNILGSKNRITAFIDFDDAIAGDPMDDLSLLACFHDAEFLSKAFDGYQSIRPLPDEHRRRFWLHLLRNIIVKAVIRVGAGYFDRSDAFFLIGTGSSGADLRHFTHQRLALALRGLETNADLSIL